MTPESFPGSGSLVDRSRRLAHPAVLLLLTAVLAYGLLLPQMGFYWDELPMSWIRYELGPAAMTKYFSTNRPVWGLLYQLTTRALPQIPIYWEVFGLFWRWLSAVLVWGIVVNAWPARRQLAILTALFFLVYPGFNQQWTSYLYSHFFIVLCFFLLSLLSMLWSFRHPTFYWPLTAASMLLSALNLWMMEYFYFLELIRPILIWAVDGTAERSGEAHPHIARIARLWSPYLAVFLGNVLWRVFVFNNQIYQPTLLSSIVSDPRTGIVEFMRSVASQLVAATLGAWAQVVHLPSVARDGPRTLAFFVGVTIAAAIMVGLYLLAAQPSKSDEGRPGMPILLVGAAALVFAGGPFWLTGLEVTTAYPANRFTLPFMLGVSLLLAAALCYLSPKPRALIAIALVALAAGRHAQWAEAYRHDWAAQKTLFWQMFWRAPSIEPNTIVLLNEGALPYYADNSLIGALNWIYDPSNRSEALDYVLFYPTSRLGGSLPALQSGLPVTYDFISEEFHGNTSQVLAFYYQPPGCLRLLDPQLDANNHFVADASLMREAAVLSSPRWITGAEEARMPAIYGPEPPHGWCYYFERAQLAAQQQNWGAVRDLADAALRLEDHPNDPVEAFVFIEGYAHTGDWDAALALSDQSYAVSKAYVAPLLCKLWSRIDADTPAGLDKATAVRQVKSKYSCTGE